MQHDEAGRVKLSVRERNILEFLVLLPGTPTKQMAASMHLTESTLNWYLQELYRELGCPGKPRLTMWALHHPDAIKGEWSWPVIHPTGCKCGKGLCAILERSAA